MFLRFFGVSVPAFLVVLAEQRPFVAMFLFGWFLFGGSSLFLGRDLCLVVYVLFIFFLLFCSVYSSFCFNSFVSLRFVMFVSCVFISRDVDLLCLGPVRAPLSDAPFLGCLCSRRSCQLFRLLPDKSGLFCVWCVSCCF